MASVSNKDLRAEIAALCTKRSVDLPPDLEQLKNPDLVALLAQLAEPGDEKPPANVAETPLRPLVAPLPPEGDDGAGDTGVLTEGSRQAGTGDGAGGDASVTSDVVAPRSAAPAPTVTAPATESTGASGYFVVEGKVVHGARDPIGAFQQVHASDFASGQEEIDRLLASGYLFRRG